MDENSNGKTNRNYKSIIDGRMVTDYQYLVEFVCKRLAKKNKGELTPQFWKLETWKRTYKLQLLAAHALLKMYSMKAILLGLQDCPFCYSLRAGFLDEKIKFHQQKVDKMQEKMVEVIKENTKKEPSDVVPDLINGSLNPFISKKSNLQKLKELE